MQLLLSPTQVSNLSLGKGNDLLGGQHDRLPIPFGDVTAAVHFAGEQGVVVQSSVAGAGQGFLVVVASDHGTSAVTVAAGGRGGYSSAHSGGRPAAEGRTRAFV